MAGVTSCLIQASFSQVSSFGARTWSQKGTTGSPELHKVNPPPVSQADDNFIQKVQAVLVSTAPDQVGPTRDSTTTTTSQLCHRFFTNIIMKFSQWDVSSSCVSVTDWDYPSFWQRKRDAAGSHVSLSAAAWVTGLCVQRKTWSNRPTKTTPETRKTWKFLRFHTSIIPDNELRGTEKWHLLQSHRNMQRGHIQSEAGTVGFVQQLHLSQHRVNEKPGFLQKPALEIKYW